MAGSPATGIGIIDDQREMLGARRPASRALHLAPPSHGALRSAAWLRANTPADAVVAAWWDHGHELAYFTGRKTLVDGALWGANLTAVEALAQAFMSKEREGAARLRAMGADYVLINFAGCARPLCCIAPPLARPLRRCALPVAERVAPSPRRYLGTGGDDTTKIPSIAQVAGTPLEPLDEKEASALAWGSLLYQLAFHRFDRVSSRGRAAAPRPARLPAAACLTRFAGAGTPPPSLAARRARWRACTSSRRRTPPSTGSGACTKCCPRLMLTTRPWAACAVPLTD
jgi:hypothetical protein